MNDASREPVRSRSVLSGKSILITRPAHQAQVFADAVHARGSRAIFASTIAIEPPDDPTALRATLDDLSPYAWIVFTSQNGVDACFAHIGARENAFAGKRIAAIGAKTAQRLHERGIQPDLTPDRFVGEAMAQALIDNSRDGDRILLVRAQHGREILAQMLEAAGRRVHVVAAYKTSYAHDPDFAQRVRESDIIAFTSASSVDGFIEQFASPHVALAAAYEKLIACIGPITQRAARDRGFHVNVVADVATTDALLDALEAHLQSSS